MSADARVFPEFARREFEGWQDPALTSRYAAAFGPVTDQVVPALVAMAEPQPGERVLDLCCGPGALSAVLRAAGARTVALDFSMAMLELAGERAPGAMPVRANAESLPLADGAFDIVVSNHGLGHVPDQRRGLAEIRRVLRRGGRLAFSAWLAPERSPAMRIFYAAVREAGDAAATATMPPGPDLHFLADMLRAGPLLAEAGFTGLRQAEVPSAWMLEAPEHLFEAFAHASVRSAMLLARQPPERLQAIRMAMVREVLTLVGPAGPWQVPMPALVIGATAA